MNREDDTKESSARALQGDWFTSAPTSAEVELLATARNSEGCKPDTLGVEPGYRQSYRCVLLGLNKVWDGGSCGKEPSVRLRWSDQTEVWHI